MAASLTTTAPTPQTFANPAEATASLTKAFNPTTPQQQAAIANAAALVPTTNPPAPTKTAEPTVLTNANPAEGTVPQNQQTMTNITNVPQGLSIGSDGYAVNANGTYAIPPSGATPSADGMSWNYQGVNYKIAPDIHASADVQRILDQSNTLIAQGDSQLASDVQDIKQRYSDLIAQQEDINNRQNASIQQSLIRGGTERYAPVNAADIASTQASAGLQKISQLTDQMNQAISAAKNAWRTDKQAELDKQLTEYQHLDDQRVAATKDLNDKLMAAYQKVQDQQTQATKDKNIFDAITAAGGSTDTGSILKQLSDRGITDVTAADIKGVFDAIAANTNSTLDKLTGDTKDFYLLQKQGILPVGVSDLGSYLQYINSNKQTPAQQLSTSLGVQQKTLAIQRTGQLIESAKALEAARIVGPQIRADKGVQAFLTISPMIDKLAADEASIKAGNFNQSIAQSVLDGITQIDTGGKQITEGQINLINQSKSIADQAQVLLQKVNAEGGTIDPKIAQQSIDLAQQITALYKNTYQQRVQVYNNRLKNVNGQDLTAYSPLTDITNLQGVVDGSYESAVSGDVQNTQAEVNAINAQNLLDNPPSDVSGAGSYDPSMWGASTQ